MYGPTAFRKLVQISPRNKYNDSKTTVNLKYIDEKN